MAPANVSTGASSESAGVFKSHLPRPQALGRSSSGSSSTSTSAAGNGNSRDTAEDDDDDEEEDDDLLNGVITSGLPKSRYTTLALLLFLIFIFSFIYFWTDIIDLPYLTWTERPYHSKVIEGFFLSSPVICASGFCL